MISTGSREGMKHDPIVTCAWCKTNIPTSKTVNLAGDMLCQVCWARHQKEKNWRRKTMTNPEKVYTVKELAKILSVHPRTIRKYLHAEAIQPEHWFKFRGRIRIKEAGLQAIMGK